MVYENSPDELSGYKGSKKGGNAYILINPFSLYRKSIFYLEFHEFGQSDCIRYRDLVSVLIGYF